MLNTTHYYRTMKAFYWFIDLMMSWSHKFILWATPEGLIQGPEQRTVMFLFVLISMLIYIASGCWFIFSFCSGDNVIVAWCRGAMNKRASPANSHGARRSPNIQCWNVWISFNLASCWFDWDFSRTHYTLSVSRRLCVCSLSRSHWRIDFFFFCPHPRGRNQRWKETDQRKTEMRNWNQCHNLLTDAFLFRLQPVLDYYVMT